MVPQICNLGVIICFIMIGTDDISFPLVYIFGASSLINKKEANHIILFILFSCLFVDMEHFAALAVSAGSDSDHRGAYDLFFCQFLYLILFQLILIAPI